MLSLNVKRRRGLNGASARVKKDKAAPFALDRAVECT